MDIRSRCQQRVAFAVFEALFRGVFVGASFLYCPFSVIFQVPSGNRRLKEEGVELMFLFSRGYFVPCCPSFILAFVFLNIYQI